MARLRLGMADAGSIMILRRRWPRPPRMTCASSVARQASFSALDSNTTPSALSKPAILATASESSAARCIAMNNPARLDSIGPLGRIDASAATTSAALA